MRLTHNCMCHISVVPAEYAPQVYSSAYSVICSLMSSKATAWRSHPNWSWDSQLLLVFKCIQAEITVCITFFFHSTLLDSSVTLLFGVIIGHCISIRASCTVLGLFLYIRAKPPKSILQTNTSASLMHLKHYQLLSWKVKTIFLCISAVLLVKSRYASFATQPERTDSWRQAWLSHVFLWGLEQSATCWPTELSLQHARAREEKSFTSDRLTPQHCVNIAERGEGLTLHVYGCQALALRSSS